MSKIALSPNASGTGTFTVAAPNTNTSYTLTLPETTGTLALTTQAITQTTGSPAYYGARAWVNFDGTGTPAIREDVNVSSITDNGTGDYTVNFTTAMPDANYAVSGSVKEADSGTTDALFKIKEIASNPATGSVTIITGGPTTAFDCNIVMVAIFR